MSIKKINICDITIKDFTSVHAEKLSFREKLDIAKKLSELKVDVIELGKVSDAKTDPVLFRTIASSLNCAVAVTADLDNNSIDHAFDAIKVAKNKKIILNVPVSTPLMEYVYQKKANKIVELVQSALIYAKSLNNAVELSLEDFTNGDIDFICSVIDVAVKSGATDISFHDMAGNLLPEDFAKFIQTVFDKCVGLNKLNTFVQCNNSLSMAVACSFASLKTSVNGIKTTTTNGNAALLSNIANCFTTLGARCGYTCGLNFTAISRIIKQISDITAERKQLSIISSATRTDDSTFSDSVTLEELTKEIKLRGYDLTVDDYLKVYESFKRVSAKKQVSGKELEVIIATTALQVPPTYKLSEYVVNSGNIITATANITLLKNDQKLCGLSAGDGPIDAAFLAIEKIIGHHYELDDFQIQSITEGKEAVGETIVTLRNNGKLYSGRGISTDIIGASIRAYVAALNKIVYEENN